jgi:hypothetical protein
MYLTTKVLLQGRLIKRKRIYVFITAGAIAKREGRAIITKNYFLSKNHVSSASTLSV